MQDNQLDNKPKTTTSALILKSAAWTLIALSLIAIGYIGAGYLFGF